MGARAESLVALAEAAGGAGASVAVGWVRFQVTRRSGEGAPTV